MLSILCGKCQTTAIAALKKLVAYILMNAGTGLFRLAAGLDSDVFDAFIDAPKSKKRRRRRREPTADTTDYSSTTSFSPPPSSSGADEGGGDDGTAMSWRRIAELLHASVLDDLIFALCERGKATVKAPPAFASALRAEAVAFNPSHVFRFQNWQLGQCLARQRAELQERVAMPYEYYGRHSW